MTVGLHRYRVCNSWRAPGFERVDDGDSVRAESEVVLWYLQAQVDVERLSLVAAASSDPPRSNDVVTHSPHSPSRSRQALALDPQYAPQPGFSQAPHTSQRQTSSQQFTPMGYGLQQQMQLCVETSLSSADKQVQLGRSAHQGQLASNLQFAVDPPYAVDHLVDRGQAMVGRKTEDKMSRRPLTDAEKIDIINRVRATSVNGKSALAMVSVHGEHKVEHIPTENFEQRNRKRTIRYTH
ncbi:MAG: hypothetical protein J3Q66DRAFT_373518 [Benniella sp.]|nr:MAG: hypothetical protein J3Q66DRAFT_373518 [Benniella sp.]